MAHEKLYAICPSLVQCTREKKNLFMLIKLQRLMDGSKISHLRHEKAKRAEII